MAPPRSIEKIYTSPQLIAEATALLDQIEELDWRSVPEDRPVYVHQLDELKKIIADIKRQKQRREFLR